MHPLTTDQLRRLDEELRYRQFNEIIDGYLNKGTMTPNQYDSCTKAQKVVIQCLKRAFARCTSEKT